MNKRCGRAFCAAVLVGLVVPLFSACTHNAPTAEDMLKAGDTKAAKGDFDGAVGDYTRASELAPSSTAPLIHRGNLKQARLDLAGAIADYTRACEINPKDAQAL